MRHGTLIALVLGGLMSAATLRAEDAATPAAQRLAEQIKLIRQLEDDFELSADGTRFLAVELDSPTDEILQMLGELPSVERIEITQSRRITFAGLSHILKQRDSLRSFQISGARRISPEMLELICSCPNLEVLSLADCHGLAGKLSRLGQLKKLVELNLSQSDIVDVDLKDVAALPGLRTLNVGYTAVGLEGIGHMVRLPKLVKLWAYTTQWKDAELAELSKFANLEELRLDWVYATDAGFAQLGQLKSLKHLNCMRTPCGDQSVREFSKLAHLEVLLLNETAVTDACGPDLAKMQALKKLVLSSTSLTDKGLKFIGKMPDLEFVGLSRTKVSANAVAALRKRHPDLDVDTFELWNVTTVNDVPEIPREPSLIPFDVNIHDFALELITGEVPVPEMEMPATAAGEPAPQSDDAKRWHFTKVITADGISDGPAVDDPVNTALHGKIGYRQGRFYWESDMNLPRIGRELKDTLSEHLLGREVVRVCRDFLRPAGREVSPVPQP